MADETKLTDSEKLDLINKRLKTVERNSFIHVGVILLGFLGIISISALISKGKELKSKL